MKKKELYLAIDLGGTKTLVTIVKSSGQIVARLRRPTPRGVSGKKVLQVVMAACEELLTVEGFGKRQIAGIGMAIPGLTDVEGGRVILTPNMTLTGLDIVGPMSKRFKCPVAIENDVNLGTLGEWWMGSARGSKNAVGIFVGTGIGGGVIIDGHLVAGHGQMAGEVGHIVVDPKGPPCGCGGRGCLEAFSSRTAIEREIRRQAAAGHRTALKELCDGNLSIIRSKTLRKALDIKDKLTHRVMTQASQMLGRACTIVRRVLDPEVIVLGGGVLEACWEFMLPIIMKQASDDPLARNSRPGRVVLSALGDDAVVLGAAAIAMRKCGRKILTHNLTAAIARRVGKVSAGLAVIDGKKYDYDLVIRQSGKIRPLELDDSTRRPTVVNRTIKKICNEGPGTLIIGNGLRKELRLSPDQERTLIAGGISIHVCSSKQAAKEYQSTKGPKALILRICR